MKTEEEHRGYVERLSRVSFYFARRYLAAKVPGKSMGELLRDHTPFLYHALNYRDYETRWNNPACRKLLAFDSLLRIYLF